MLVDFDAVECFVLHALGNIRDPYCSDKYARNQSEHAEQPNGYLAALEYLDYNKKKPCEM
jgi:hypothetical protein